ncbi:hypothetical protein N7478_012700 [Penicillium angulare]|uniref:uncharacterized protein n=1 Tax=Penicillium angulare TaxID=116970 RepID=UPI002540F2A7|nr:uncharacterized protein N7478_012700 [Penicillium angulare]KAJ5256596.1 hypothetical protein N7478_012700 [Penicillium angulare]
MSEFQKNQQNNEGANNSLNITAALYWDINCVSISRKIVNGTHSKEDSEIYAQMKNSTDVFISQVMTGCFTALQTNSLSRCTSFINEFGWKLLAICAHSEAFRSAGENLNEADWLSFKNLLAQNQRSVEVFANSRDLEWRGPLLPYASSNLLPGLREALTPDINLAQEHPHHLVQLPDGHLKRPTHRGLAQVNISSSIDYKNPKINLRTPQMRACYLCRSPQTCECRHISMVGDMVELVEHLEKGVTVRALANFRKGEHLGEFSGQIYPESHSYRESVYSLLLNAYDAEARQNLNVGTVFPDQYGNWTRFISHSCEPTARFVNLIVGNEAISDVQAERSISMFEELTVDYGEEYFKTRPIFCRCGTKSCKKPPPSED